MSLKVQLTAGACAQGKGRHQGCAVCSTCVPCGRYGSHVYSARDTCNRTCNGGGLLITRDLSVNCRTAAVTADRTRHRCGGLV